MLQDSRPVSRRGSKSSNMYIEEDIGRPSTVRRPTSGVRPPSSFQQRIPTAGKLNTGILPPQSNILLMNSVDRPITQQGLAGLRTGTARSQRRQVLDKRYYEGLLRLKMKEIATEVHRISGEIQTQRQQEAAGEAYATRVKEVATELIELQAELSDLNQVVDYVHTGTDANRIAESIQEIRSENTRDAARLEQLFNQNNDLEQSINRIQLEIENEKNKTQKLLEEMSMEERIQFEELKTKEEQLLHDITNQQRELEQQKTKHAQLMDSISSSQIKQDAVRLHQKLREKEERKLQLEEEERNKTSPAQEHEQLLQRVREDNAEMAAMDRQMKEIQQQITAHKQELQLIDQDMEEINSDRHQKFKELKRREETMELFLSSFDANREAEINRIESAEGKIEMALQEIAKNLQGAGSLPSQDEFAVMKETLTMKEDELEKSKMTSEELSREEAKLVQNVAKIDDLEDKISNEITNLRSKISEMQQDMKVLEDLDKLRADIQSKRESLQQQRDELLEKKVPTDKLKQLKEENEMLQKQLNENDTYVQLHTLEKKLQLLTQNNEDMDQNLQSRRSELDYQQIKDKALQLLNQYNAKLKQRSLKKN